MPRSSINNNHNQNSKMEMGHNIEEKRAKREIANMNERRRMQNINAGFHSLRSLLPQKHEGEKLSKAAILQHTATYVYELEKEMAKLLSQVSELKKMAGVGSAGGANINTPDWLKRLESQPPDCPSCKRRKYENNHRLDIDSSPMNGDGSSTESSSEQEMNSKFNRSSNRNNNNHTHNNGSYHSNNNKRSNDANSLRRQLSRVEKELQEERRLRLLLEDEINSQQGKPINGGGRPYHQSMQFVDNVNNPDEVEIASESIEIEMHSCPASPPEMMISGTAQEPHTANGGHAQIYPSSHFSRIDLGQTATTTAAAAAAEQQKQRQQKQQNAIALPIDVPFLPGAATVISNDSLTADQPPPTAQISLKRTNLSNGSGQPLVMMMDPQSLNQLIMVESGKIHSATSNDGTATPQILQLISSNPNSKIGGGPTILTTKSLSLANKDATNSKSSNSNGNNNETDQVNKTSRQNLNTIVEAIRHLEGKSFVNQKMKEEDEDDDSNNDVNSLNRAATTTNNNDPKLNDGAAAGDMDENDNIDTKTETIKMMSCTPTIVSAAAPTANTSSAPSSSSTITAATTTRPQIIQIQRPNVIVANSVEN